MEGANQTFNILIIDDEPMILEIAGEILTYLGHKVWMAESGNQGIKIFSEKHHELHLVIVDLLMPDMNGKECFEQMQKIDDHVPIVLSTGISDVENKEGFKHLNVFGFLEKPYTLVQLRDILQKLESVNTT